MSSSSSTESFEDLKKQLEMTMSQLSSLQAKFREMQGAAAATPETPLRTPPPLFRQPTTPPPPVRGSTPPPPPARKRHDEWSSRSGRGSFRFQNDKSTVVVGDDIVFASSECDAETSSARATSGKRASSSSSSSSSSKKSKSAPKQQQRIRTFRKTRDGTVIIDDTRTEDGRTYHKHTIKHDDDDRAYHGSKRYSGNISLSGVSLGNAAGSVAVIGSGNELVVSSAESVMYRPTFEDDDGY